MSSAEQKTRDLIDGLKSVCANYGLGNTPEEFNIISQVFLYKFLNDKFSFEAKKLNSNLKDSSNWEQELTKFSEEEWKIFSMQLGPEAARLKPNQLISYLFNHQNDSGFSKLFDDTLEDISTSNSDIFSVKTDGGSSIPLFERITELIRDSSKRDDFTKALINKLTDFSFEGSFEKGYDFFATIFEYLIKDYNNDSGGQYAEYYTPHSISKLMAQILVPQKKQENIKDVGCYDPSAGSGTLLMSIAHVIGEKNCSIFTQDISQKSSNLLRLNLILNNLVHSIPNVIQGNTILTPFHKENKNLKEFDYIVSNPPFKLDFSEFRDQLDSKENQDRFFAGIPKTPPKKKKSMAIYLLFIQHIIFSLKDKGKAAVVVPTGFLTGQTGILRKIHEKLVDGKMLAGVVSMPSNIFATTGTNVSILFINKENEEDVVLLDASNLGEVVKEGKNQKTVLTEIEEQQIIDTFNNKLAVDDLSVVVSYEDIKSKKYSLNPGQYFEIKIEYIDISDEEYNVEIKNFEDTLNTLFSESKELEIKINKNLSSLKYD